MLHRDRRRAESFGADAEQYDRARPTYPAALVDDLVGEGPVDVLDVGCGTGKAGRLFAARGCRVLGVEPDERMAAVARGHGVPVEVATFEDWAPAGRRFDLVAAGQSWHWVDPVAGPVKAAAVLRPGGRLALFWNIGEHEPDLQEALGAVYEAFAPSLAAPGAGPGRAKGADVGDHLAGVRACGRFGEPELRSYPWVHTYSRDEWLDQLASHSDHRVLPPGERSAVHAAIAAAIDRLGGSVVITYRAELVTAALRPDPAGRA